VLWCKFGGVPGGGGVSTDDSDAEEAEVEGVDGSDMTLHTVDELECQRRLNDTQASGQRPRCGCVQWTTVNMKIADMHP
jgi:hypothetical protein